MELAQGVKSPPIQLRSNSDSVPRTRVVAGGRSSAAMGDEKTMRSLRLRSVGLRPGGAAERRSFQRVGEGCYWYFRINSW